MSSLSWHTVCEIDNKIKNISNLTEPVLSSEIEVVI
jgi:hypothetical protein